MQQLLLSLPFAAFPRLCVLCLSFADRRCDHRLSSSFTAFHRGSAVAIAGGGGVLVSGERRDCLMLPSASAAPPPFGRRFNQRGEGARGADGAARQERPRPRGEAGSARAGEQHSAAWGGVRRQAGVHRSAAHVKRPCIGGYIARVTTCVSAKQGRTCDREKVG